MIYPDAKLDVSSFGRLACALYTNYTLHHAYVLVVFELVTKSEPRLLRITFFWPSCPQRSTSAPVAQSP